MLDAETRGLFTSIGIQKGKKFAPDERMKRILTDGVALGNAAARSKEVPSTTKYSLTRHSGMFLAGIQ